MNIGKLFAIGLTLTGALAALPSPSSAQGLDLYIGPGGPDLELRDRRYDDDYRPYRGCSERQAIRRAYRLGLRDPEVQSITRRGSCRRGWSTRPVHDRVFRKSTRMPSYRLRCVGCAAAARATEKVQNTGAERGTLGRSFC